jgi:hypothetical protein
LALSAGFAVADDLARVALAATEEGQGIDGILVINPEPGDNTAGVVGEPEEKTRMTQRRRNHADNEATTAGWRM